MSDSTSNIRLRIPNDLLAKVTEIAGKNQRSVNAEILARLADAYEWAAFDPNHLAGELDDIDRRLAVIFTHLGLLDLGEDPRVEAYKDTSQQKQRPQSSPDTLVSKKKRNFASYSSGIKQQNLERKQK